MRPAFEFSTNPQVPPEEFPVPAAITDVVGKRAKVIWVNQEGGMTARIDSDPMVFVKWDPIGSKESLADEAGRMQWLAGRHPVPKVIDLIARDDGDLLITEAVTDESGAVALSAVDPIWAERPNTAIRAIAVGLRTMHSLPIEECPFEWSVGQRLSDARQIPAGFPDRPPIDVLAICHGDPCSPNTLIDAEGNFAASIDLARVGVADRWADLAVATMALAWNYRNYDEAVFWEEYGAEPDVERIEYYRALWNVG